MFLLALREGAEVVMSEAFASPLTFDSQSKLCPVWARTLAHVKPGHIHSIVKILPFPAAESALGDNLRVRNQVRTSGR